MICKKCTTDRPLDRFRMRTKRGYSWRQGTCMNCEAEAQLKRHNNKKDIPEYKEVNRDRTKRYRLDNIDVVREKDLIRKQTDHYKEYRKKYIAKNKEKIFKQEQISKRRYNEKNRDALSDIYVARKIIGKSTGIASGEIPIALIKIKRLQLLGKRILKEQSLKR